MIVNLYKTRVQIYCQNWFFTDLISMRGQGVRGWPSGKTEMCQVQVYSGRGSSQVWTKADEGQGQGAGQGVSPAGVGDRLDSTTKDNKR